MYKVLVTGAKGQLGQDLVRELSARGHEVLGVDVDEMDITNEQNTFDVITDYAPDVIMHCAAWTAVDAAEEKQEACHRVNALGTLHVAKAAKAVDAKILYLSTDYVFDGSGERPWEPDDPVGEPLNVYGKTKYDGEVAIREQTEKHFIVRISWVFGPKGHNFVKTMLKLGESGRALTVVDDQFGTPTYTPDLAVLLCDMMVTDRYGTYHASNEGGFICWYDFACEIFRQAGMDISVSPVSGDTYAAKAKRPSNSRLSKKKLYDNGFAPLPDWRDALARFLETTGC